MRPLILTSLAKVCRNLRLLNRDTASLIDLPMFEDRLPQIERWRQRHCGLLDDCRQDRCLARLGPGVRRKALHAAAHLLLVWLSSGLQSVGHRDEAWLERGLPSS